MRNIQLLNKISPSGMDVFDRSKYLVSEEVSNPKAILVRSASMHDMELPDSLRAIARAGAGVNNIPLAKCTDKGIVVFNTPGANANAVKEMVLCAMLLSARKIYPAMTWVQSLKGQGEQVEKLVEKEKNRFVGPELRGKRLGVVGLGAIGIMVANTARHFGMEVYGYDPFLSVETAWNISRDIHRAANLKEIYEHCDFITLHCPSTPETRGMINNATINQMKHGVRLLNFARGDLVVTEDLIAGLDEKQIRCYVTDFPTDEMLGHPGVLAVPHLGASTPESEDNCARMAAEQILDYLENGNIVNSVNLPNVCMPRAGGHRIAIIHKNVPAMITQITSVIAEEKANIENLTNKSRGDVAYTLVDLDGESSEGLVAKLKTIDNVIRVKLYR